MKPPEPPVLYRRKYTDDNHEVSIKDLREAYHHAASILTTHGDKYLPLFERLDKEIKDRDRKEELKARAQKITEQRQKPKPSSP